MDYFFQPGYASVPSPLSVPLQDGNTTHCSIPSISLLSSLPPVTLPFALKDGNCEDDATLIHQAVDAAHLPPDKKPKLNHLLQTSQVCTLRLGRTDVLQHQIYSGYGKYSDPLKFFTLC